MFHKGIVSVLSNYDILCVCVRFDSSTERGEIKTVTIKNSSCVEIWVRSQHDRNHLPRPHSDIQFGHLIYTDMCVASPFLLTRPYRLTNYILPGINA